MRIRSRFQGVDRAVSHWSAASLGFEYPEWHSRAACRGSRLPFAGEPAVQVASSAAMRIVCERCPVFFECEVWAARMDAETKDLPGGHFEAGEAAPRFMFLAGKTFDERTGRVKRSRGLGSSRQCSDCGQVFELSAEFWPLKRGYLMRRCIACQKRWLNAKYLRRRSA